MLTEAERRGAVLVLALFALGTAWDAWRSTHPRSTLLEPPAVGAAAHDFASPDAADPAPEPAAIAGRTESALPGQVPLLDLNRAGLRELDALPGIGPVLARRILDYRAAHGRFAAAEELLGVPGIGPSLFQRLRSRVRV